MARERKRPVCFWYPKRVERAGDGSGVWLDERLVRWHEFRAVGCVTYGLGWNPWEDDAELFLGAALQLTDGTHAWTWLAGHWSERGEVWLRRLVEPELPLRPFADLSALLILAKSFAVLWPPQDNGRSMYNVRRARWPLWRPHWFAQLP